MTSVAVSNVSDYPDTCLWTTHPDHHDLILCGSYKLLEDGSDCGGARIGSISLYKFEKNKLTRLSRLENLSGVLAMSLVENTSNFVAALSSGSIGLFNIACANSLKQVCQSSIRSSEAKEDLCLSICVVDNYIWYSTASGSTGRCIISEFEIKPEQSFKNKNTYEAWSITSSPAQPDVAYSSADDGSIHIWDARKKEKATSFVKSHVYGVCSLSFPDKNCTTRLCSGGFDNQICFWDTRVLKLPQTVSSIPYTVWNVKWFDSNQPTASISAMEQGNHCIMLDRDFSSFSECASYEIADSMVHCSDVFMLKKENDDSHFICCTSYNDSNLHVWKY